MGFFDQQDAEVAAEKAAQPTVQYPAGSEAPGYYSDLDKSNPAVEATTKPVEEPQTVWRGSLLPFSKDSAGSISFDPFNAGPIGAYRQAYTLPGRVWSGETKMPATFDPASNDPNIKPMMGEVLNFATSMPQVNPMVRSGDLMIPGEKRTAPDMSRALAPSSTELKSVGGSQLNAFRDAPVRYDPAYMNTLADQIKQKLVNEGVFPEDAPGLYKSIERLRPPKDVPAGATVEVNPGNLMAIRKNIAAKFGVDSENQHGVKVAFDHFNDFIENPPKQAVLAGPAAEAATTFKEGLANYAAGKRSDELQDIQRTADFRAASAHSGANTDNTLRQRITAHILNDQKIKGYSPEELAQLENVPLGTPGNNIMRWTGNVMGGGGGLAAGTAGAIGTGAMHFLGVPPFMSTAIGSAVPAVGSILKKAAGEGTAEALSAFDNTVRQRSPLFKQVVGGQDLIPTSPGRDAMAATLMRMTGQAKIGGPGIPTTPAIDPTKYDPENYT